MAKVKLDENENEEKIKEKCIEIEQECESRKTDLNSVFAKIDDRRRVSINLSCVAVETPYVTKILK